jgi:hypothetical protein
MIAIHQMIEVYCGVVAVSYRNATEIQLFDVDDGINKLLKSVVNTTGRISHCSKLKDGRLLAAGDKLELYGMLMRGYASVF